MSVPADLASIEAVGAGLADAGYIASPRCATAIFLAHHLRKPMLVEGPAGVGKTELAKATARSFGLPLIRLQCYEGLDESKALYEWKYGKQLLYTQILKDKLGEQLRSVEGLGAALVALDGIDDTFYSERFLEPRPLLRALQSRDGAVLLVDEVDKAGPEFEAFLLEILSEYQVTIPELGTVAAAIPPFVVLTSNATRELGEALKRRCLHLHIDYPDPALEARILDVRVPGIDARLRERLVAFVHGLRDLDLKKLPSVSETIDWARALVLLHVAEIDAQTVRTTLDLLLKYESDVEAVVAHLPALLGRNGRSS